MKRKLITFVLLTLALMILTGCKQTSVPAGKDTSGNIVESNNVGTDAVAVHKTEKQEEKEKSSNIIPETNKDKPVRSKAERYDELNISDESNYFSQEHEEIILDYLETHGSSEEEPISDKTFLYAEERIRKSHVPNCDYGEWMWNSGVNMFMMDKLTYYPTEAIRTTEDGKYCLMYDLDTDMRVFVWYFQKSAGSWYEQFGYPIYMAETLTYEDFADIKIGDYSEAVEVVDPKVTEISLRHVIKADTELKYTQARIENGYPPRSLHLLTDGLLIITYGRDETGFFITDIEFNEDFMIDTVAGPQCCRINPLDYVTQG